MSTDAGRAAEDAIRTLSDLYYPNVTDAGRASMAIGRIDIAAIETEAAQRAVDELLARLPEALRRAFPVPKSYEEWQSMADRTYESDAALLAAELRKPR